MVRREMVGADVVGGSRWAAKVPTDTVHSVIFSKTLFDFKKSVSGPIELKFSGMTLSSILYAPIYFGVSIFSLRA